MNTPKDIRCHVNVSDIDDIEWNHMAEDSLTVTFDGLDHVYSKEAEYDAISYVDAARWDTIEWLEKSSDQKVIFEVKIEEWDHWANKRKLEEARLFEDVEDAYAFYKEEETSETHRSVSMSARIVH